MAVDVLVGVEVRVDVEVRVGVSVGVGVEVLVGVGVTVGVDVLVEVGVHVGVAVSAGLGVQVALGVRVGVSVGVNVSLGAGMDVGVSVSVGLVVPVEVAVRAGVSVTGVTVTVDVGTSGVRTARLTAKGRYINHVVVVAVLSLAPATDASPSRPSANVDTIISTAHPTARTFDLFLRFMVSPHALYG